MSAPAPAARHVAAFDFDGTIARRDSLGPFLARVAGLGGLTRALALHTPRIAAVTLGRADRDATKEAVMTSVLGGRTAGSISGAGRAYADHLWERQKFRPEMLERLRWHRDADHEIVIVSASLDSYLTPLAPRLGVDHVISTSLEVDDHGLVTGRLVGGNGEWPEVRVNARAAGEVDGHFHISQPSE